MKTQPIWKIIVIFLTLFGGAVGFAAIANAEGEVITSMVIREKVGVTSENYPLTFGHVFKKGDVPQSVTVQVDGVNLPTQVDVKTRYSDQSIRHAVISVLLPTISARQDLQLLLVSAPPQSNAGELSKTEILATEVGAVIRLTGLSDSGYSGELNADLRKSINETSSLKYWLKGPVCTEILVNNYLNRSLNAAWEVRLYPGTQYIRISHSIENVNLHSRGNVNYAVDISQGNASPSRVYSKETFQHNHSSRWRKVFWLGEAPPEVEIRYDLPYMIATGMVMPYDTSLKINESTIDSQYSAWLSSNRDVMGNGFINKNFGTTGGRPEIGVLPKWAALYLLSMDNRMRDILLGHGELAGHIPVHFREDDQLKSFYGRPVSINDRPNFSLHNISTTHPPIGTTITDWSPDRSHQGSFAYLPYLITGEKWFLDEIYYWGGYNLIYHEYMRDGNGSQDFSAGKDGSFGSLYGQLRGVAWALRNVSDASIVASDEDIEKNYFATKVNNNIDWLWWANSAESNSHGLAVVRHQREAYDHSIWPTKVVAPWQHDFLVLVLSDIVRKQAGDNYTAVNLRKHLANFTIGRFVNNEFPKYEAAGYLFPLSDKLGNYYPDGDWGKYWNDVADLNNLDIQSPRRSFNELDYPFSYAAIALGANALLTDLPKGIDAFIFLKSNLSYPEWASKDPTWAFSPVVKPPSNLRVLKK